MSAAPVLRPAEPPPDAVPRAATDDLTADAVLPQMGWTDQTPRVRQRKEAGQQQSPV